jgi:hypothetical protein
MIAFIAGPFRGSWTPPSKRAGEGRPQGRMVQYEAPMVPFEGPVIRP